MSRLAVVLALLLPTLGACAPQPSSPARNVVLITLDTTRADALGCYGATGDPTPHLDALARESVTYDRAYTCVPMTLPSHCSMMTGLYPPRHTVRDNAYWPLPASADTLAEAAARADLETAAFLAAVVLDRPFALDQGFDVYDVPTPAPGEDPLHGERPAEEVIDHALAWLDGRDEERPFLLWVHLFDPHTPYAPPPGWREDLEPYAAEVALMDHELGRLLDRLRADGRLDDSLVLVVGDHGEAFGEHGEVTHGDFCYEPTMRVPFLMRHPDGHRAGEREDALVSIVDVHPTALTALGLDVPAGIDGVDLLASAPDAGRGIYLETYAGYFSQGWSPLAGWVDGEGKKYLHSSEPELYDLAVDPEEATNLVDRRADELRRFRLAIADVHERSTLAAEHNQGVDPELVDRIRGLGYAALGGAYDKVPHPLAPSDRPAPWRMAQWSQRAFDAANLVVAGRHAEAEPELRAVLAANPLNFVALHHLAYSLIFQNRPAEAIEPLRTLLREGPKKAEWFQQLAICLYRTGEADEAVEAMQQAVAIEPENEQYRGELVRLLQREGREEEARRYENP